MSNDLKMKTSNAAHSKGNKEGNVDLPKVLVLHDSVLNHHVQGSRLGKSYNFKLSMQRNSALADAQMSLQAVIPSAEKPDAVVTHSGVNDLKSKDAKDPSKTFVFRLKEAAKKNLRTKLRSDQYHNCRGPQIKHSERVFQRAGLFRDTR